MRSISASLASLSSCLRSSPTASATFSFSATKAFVHSALAAASALGTNASNRSASFRACSCLRTKDFAISFTMNTQSSATETWARRAAVSRCVQPPLTGARTFAALVESSSSSALFSPPATTRSPTPSPSGPSAGHVCTWLRMHSRSDSHLRRQSKGSASSPAASSNLQTAG